jgi:hypothetical protein
MIQKYYILLVVFCLAACGGKEQENTYPLQTALKGTWLENCYSDGPYTSQISGFEFNGSNFKVLNTSWAGNSTCAGDPYNSGIFSGDYSVGESITTDSGLNAMQINFEYDNESGVSDTFNILRLEGEEFILGDSDLVINSIFSRPTALDFDTVYVKQ